VDARASYDGTLPSTSLTIIPASTEKPPAPRVDMTAHDEAWARYYREKASSSYKGRHFDLQPQPEPVPVKINADLASELDGSTEVTFKASVSLKQAYEGFKVHLNYKSKVQCTQCKGKSFRLEKGSDCTVCGGSGHAGQRGFIGRMLLGDPCGNCEGEGYIKVPTDCARCSASGIETIRDEKTIECETWDLGRCDFANPNRRHAAHPCLEQQRTGERRRQCAHNKIAN